MVVDEEVAEEVVQLVEAVVMQPVVGVTPQVRFHTLFLSFFLLLFFCLRRPREVEDSGKD